jgi:hypothetical protein
LFRDRRHRRTPGVAAAGVCALLLFAGAAGRASAQTLYGANGLFVHPTAYLQPKGTLNLNASFFQVDPGNGGALNNWIPMGVSYGVNESFNVGVTYLARRFRPTGSSPYETGDSYGAFFRGQLSNGARDGTQVAVNLSFLGGDVRQGAFQLVASRPLSQTARYGTVVGHAGLQLVRRDDRSGEDNDTSAGLFLGVEVPVYTRLSVVAEGATKLSFDQKPATGFGVKYTSKSGTNVGVGYINPGRSRTNRFFFGIGFPLGEGRKPETAP